jgi:hypothetical protein
MWFCLLCRKTVERNIVTYMKIEERCNHIMTTYESRIAYLEEEIKGKFKINKVKTIVREEIRQSQIPEMSSPWGMQMSANPDGRKKEPLKTVISEIQERRGREKNIVIYGVPAPEPEETEERKKKNTDVVLGVMKACKVTINDDSIVKVRRLGKYKEPEKEEKKTEHADNHQQQTRSGRPILVVLEKRHVQKYNYATQGRGLPTYNGQERLNIGGT